MRKKDILFYSRVTFTAIGAYTEDFLNLLNQFEVKIYEVRNINGVMHITIRRSQYKKATVAARSCGIRIRVFERKGLFYKFRNMKKHTGVISGVLIACIIVLFMQKFIWKINIYGNDTISENQILKTVESYGVRLGALSSQININSVEIGTKLGLKDITWLNIEKNGSKIDIYINESSDIEKSEIDTKTPCNIIAGKSGIIVDTEVYSGTLIYKKGSGVSEGAVIVSGVVNDGADNLLLTHANAKIIAEFTETVAFRQNFTTNEKITSDIITTEKELMLLGFVIPITRKTKIDENCVCSEIIENCSIFGLELPWKIKTNTYTGYEDVEITRTYDDVNRILEQNLEKYCSDFLSEYEIIDINKNLEADQNGITLNAVIKLRGNIAEQQEILRKKYLTN